jgi:hypothetical protein
VIALRGSSVITHILRRFFTIYRQKTVSSQPVDFSGAEVLRRASGRTCGGVEVAAMGTKGISDSRHPCEPPVPCRSRLQRTPAEDRPANNRHPDSPNIQQIVINF